MKTNRSVKTILRTDKKKKDGKCPMYYQIIFNSKQIRFPVGASLNLKDWDKSKNYPKGNVILRKKLEKREQEIRDFIDECDLHNKVVTKELLKEFYNGKDDKKDFYYHFDRFTEKKFYTISEGTQYHYLLLKKQLLEYSPTLYLNQLDYNFFNDFFHYLRDKKEVGNSGLAMRRKNFITVLEEFVKLDLISKNYCKDISRYKENSVDVFLTKKEINKLINVDLEIGKLAYGLNLTRDLFLFSCYTGLRYSDVITLTKNEIKNGKIIKDMKKTGKKIMIPIIAKAKEIMKKYDFIKKNELIFPGRCNVSVNRDLKLISSLSKIDKHITFHIARHTFGSTLGTEGIQTVHIMKLMGHSSPIMTSRYVNSDNEILKNVMNKVNFSVY